METFFTLLRENNIHIKLVDGRLSVKFPGEVVDERLLAQIRERKEDLIKYLGKSEFVAIPVIGVEDSYALSAAQHRMWVLHQLTAGQGAYNIPGVYEVESRLDVERLSSALQQLVLRHEILRTVFREDAGGDVRQYVLADSPVLLQQFDVDASELPGKLRADFDTVFDLAEGPLLKVCLYRVGADRYVLSYVMHHIISDGWSIGILLRDLLRSYEGGVLPALPIQYKDYSAWQQEQLNAGDRSYWEDVLSGELPLLDLYPDRVRPAVKSYHGGVVRSRWSTEQSNDFRALVRAGQGTLFMGVLSVVQVLLYRYSGQSDLIIGSPVAGRSHPDLEDQLGLYVNTIALRSRVQGAGSYRSHLQDVRAVTLSAYDHQLYPFDELVAGLDLPRDMSRHALFDVMVVLHQGNGMQATPGGLSVSRYSGVETASSKFDLLFNFTEDDGCISIGLEYNSDIFDRWRMERLLVHLEGIVRCVLRDPDQSLSGLDYLGSDERDRLLYANNDTAVAYRSDVTLPALFAEQVSQRPDAVALVYAGRSWSYRELDAASDRLGAYLRDVYGVGRNDVVGVCLDRSEKLIIGILGVLKAGGAYMPVDPFTPAERISYLVDDSGCKHLLDAPSYEAGMGYTGVQLPVINEPHDLAYVIYTSGSTGLPKGCMLEHGGVVNRLAWMWSAYDYSTADIILQKTTFTFDVSVWELFLPLCWGARMVLCPREDIGSPEALSELIGSTQVSNLHFVPSMLNAFLASVGSDATQLAKLGSLRQVITSGEALSAETVSTWYSLLPAVPLHNLYGPTEASIDVTAYSTQVGDERIPIGSPIWNTSMYVLDDHLQLVPTGVGGELYIGGAGLARGYLNRPELTSSRFISHPFEKGARLYRTGDIGRWLPDGNIEYLGRSDDQVKVRGYRIELGEIENSIQQYAGVDGAVVLARKGAGGDNELIAFIAGRREALDVQQVRVHLGRMLPAYMIPAYIILLDELPLTANGKVNRKKLLEQDITGIHSGDGYVAPRTDIECQLAQIWEQVLGVQQVGVYDDFFALGGHSLKATRLASKIFKLTGARLGLKELLVHTVLEKQALLISDTLREEYTAIPVIGVEESYALSAAQHRMWVLHQLTAGQGAYNIPGVYEVEGRLDVDRLSSALQQLVLRHEILRTVFREDAGGDVRQYVLADSPVLLQQFEVDASELPGRLRADVDTVFDLAEGPLLKVCLYRVGADRYVLSYVMHHIISDGWSVGILLRDLLRSYESGTLPALPIQYKDYSAWQQDRLRAADRSYWEDVLSGELPLLDLYPDRVRPAVKSYRGGVVRSRWDIEQSNAFRALVGAGQGTLFMGVLSVVQVLLYRYSGQSDLIIGSPVAGRSHPDLEDQLGLYVNTIALRSRVHGAGSYRSHLQDVRAVTLSAYDHQLYPFDELVAGLDLPRDMSRHALFDVMVVLQQGVNTLSTPDGLTVGRYGGVETASSKFDLLFNFTEEDGCISIGLEYNSDIFDRWRMERLLVHLEGIVRCVLRDPDQSLSGLDYLGSDERDRLLYTNNDTAVTYRSDVTLPALFAEQVSQRPDAVALVYAGRSWSYRELDAASDRLGAYLRDVYGVGRNDVVGVCLDRSEKLIIGILGVLKAGGAYMPVDPFTPAERISYLVGDSGCKHLLDAPSYEVGMAYTGVQLPVINEPHDLAYVIYTSGSTGLPKGCMLEHGGVVNRLAWMWSAYDYSTADIILQKTTFTFDVSVWELFLPLCWGARMVLCPREDIGSPEALSELIGATQVSNLHFVPSMLNAFLASVGSDATQLSKLGSLRQVITSGEALSAETVSTWYSLLPAVPLHNLYGPTEASIDVTAYSTQVGDERIPIGSPIWNTSMYVLDDHLQLVPTGVGGELYIGGAGLARGYLNRPELTSSRFIRHPFVDGARLYRTGDIGRWLPDGNIEYLGRSDDQVKVRGYRIELGEIENSIQQYAGVDGAVVLARKGAGGDNELIAFIAGRREALDVQQVRVHLGRMLPAYMIPAYIILLDELPLTANGKVNRKKLLEQDMTGIHSGDSYVAPRNELEEKLLLIWQEVLGAQEARIGINDSFFSLGGDSIKAIKVVVRIRQQLDVHITTGDLYVHQSIGQLSERIMGQSATDTIYQELAAGEKQIAAFEEMIIADSGGRALLPEGIEAIYPLARIEQGMIYSSLLRPEEPVYYDQFTFYIQIRDQAAFHAALAQLVDRHPILRTKYYMRRFSQPAKVVLRHIDMPVSYQELAGLSDEDKNRQLNLFLQNDAAERLDFDDDLLWKFRVFHLMEDRYFVVLSVHHAALDGWSVSVFGTELSQLLATDKPVQLATLKYSYKDYCALLLGRGEQHTTELYWKKLLDGYSRNKLPFNYKGVKISQVKGMKKVYRQIDKEVLAGINRVVSGYQLSFKSVCLAAHICMLHILSTETDVVTGMVTHERPELENSEYILGCFLNTLPVRVDMGLHKDILSLLRYVHQYIVTSRAHDLHLSEIARITDSKSSTGNPIFDTLFNYTDFHAYEQLDKSSSMQGMASTLQVSMLEDANEMTNTLMDVEVDKTLDRFLIKIKYAPAYFSDSEAQYALDLYVRILSLFAKDVKAALSVTRSLPAAELKKVVVDFNNTIIPYPDKATLHHIFETQVLKTPSNIALVQQGASMSYSELNEKANQLAWFLLGKGVKAGDNIGLLVNRSFSMIIGMYGILKAGGAYVPIDPHYPVDRQEYIVRNSGLQYIVTDEEGPLQQSLTDISFVVLQQELIETQPVTNPGLTIDSRQLAYTIYTSGSTGRPKGVMIAHHAAVNLVCWVNDTFQVGEKDRLLFITSMCFDLSVYDIFGMLAAGGALVIAQQEEVQDVRKLSHLLQAERITFWDSVPTTMNYLVGELEMAGDHYVQHDLRLVFLSGDWIPVQLPGRISTYFPRAAVISLGGATEGTVWSNYYPIGTVDPSWSSIPYGVPISNNFFYILDELLQPVPTGVVGELYIGGVGVAEGYANDAVKTAAAFKEDPFNTVLGGRMYKTGDLGRMLPDGNMEFIGRKDNQVKIRGFRVELGEIESMLQKHSHVMEAIVDVIRSTGNNQLCAYLVMKVQTGRREIRDYLKQIFPDYMIPDHYVFLPALPLNSNGKIDRKALPMPDEDIQEMGYNAPVTVMEKRLAAIWQSLLLLERVGLDDDFFELGANSLSVGAFVSRVSREMTLTVSIREVFAHTSIRKLAAVLESRDMGRFEQIAALDVRDGYPLSAAQWRMWLLAQLGEGNAAYHIPGAYVLEGRLDLVALTAAFDRLLARHESLRTVFRENENGELLQYILPALPTALGIEDLSQVADQEERLKELIREDRAVSFDPAAGPLLSVKLYQLAGSKWVFAYVMHHIISDGWSMGIFIRELLHLYNAGVKGEMPVLAPLRIQYKDYAAWQQKQLSGTLLQQHSDYWSAQFAGPLPVLQLPADMIRPAIKTYNGGQVKAVIHPELANGLKVLAREQEATLFMSLLSLVNALLYNYTGQEDIILGTAVAGREHVDLENQIGFYVNTLALRTRFRHSESYRDLLSRVKVVTLGAYEHQVYPFDTLVNDLSIKRDLSRNLLFDVMVVLQNTRIGNTGTLPGVAGLTVSRYEGAVHLNSQFDLAFDFLDTPEGLLVTIEYNSDIFYGDTVQKIMHDLELLLKALLNNPDQPLSQLLYGSPQNKTALINDLEL